MKIRNFFSILTSLAISGAFWQTGILSVGAEDSDQPNGVCISEICASNSKCLRLSDGTSPDWIELWNQSDEPIDLSGYGLSDSNKKRSKFVFPEGTILNPDTYMLIICDDTLRTDTDIFHAPFQLSSDGETLYLTAPDGRTTVDSVAFPPMDTDISYGIGSRGVTFLTPTPMESNLTAEEAVMLDAPQFSAPGGFYDTPFSLTLSDAVQNKILYTLDGSDPRCSDAAQVYDAEIKIYDNTSDPNILSAYTNTSWLDDTVYPTDLVEKGIVVRAVCMDENGNFSKTETNSYFVGKTAGYYQNLHVLSIASDTGSFFDDETGIFVNSNYYNEGREWERPCNIQIFAEGKPEFSEDIGIRVAGNWSRAYPQKSMTLYARNEYGAAKMKYDFFDGAAKDIEGKPITEFKKVTLRNGGDGYDHVRFRDDLNAYLADGLDISVQAKNDYIVFINGEFWGYYSMQEKLEDNYIESHFHVSASDVTTVKNGVFEGDEDVFNDYKAFFDWALQADMTDAQNYQQFCEKMDVQSLIDFLITESYVCNWDSLINLNNIMLWRTNSISAGVPYADGRWRFILYDTEYSAGFSGMDASYNYLANMDSTEKTGCYGALFYHLMDNAKFAEQFLQSYENAVKTQFSYERAADRISHYHSLLSEVYADTEKRFGYHSDYTNGALTVMDFFQKRPEYARSQCESIVSKYHSLESGDVDCNRTCEIADAVLLARILSEQSAEINVFSCRNADINRDGILSMTDMLLLLNSICDESAA